MNDGCRKIKIAVVLPSFDVGGAESMVAVLVSHLNLDCVDVTVICLCGNARNNHMEEMIRRRGVAIRYLGKQPGFSAKTMFRLFSEIKSIQPDVIHSHAFPCMYCAPWAFLLRVPLVHTIHTTPEIEASRKVRKAVMGMMYKSHRAFPVAISEINQEKTARFYGLKLADVKMIHNPVDLSIFKKSGVSSCERKSGGVVISIVASLIPLKNHSMLLRSFKKVVDFYPDSSLWIIGDGPLRSELESLSVELGVKDNVTFWGSREDVPDLLRRSDIFSLVSHYEGLPMSVLEAMATGLPVVATNVGGVPDLVTDNGILIDDEDEQALFEALVCLISNPELRAEMGGRAINYCSQYDVEVIADHYEELYKECSKY